MERRKLTIEEHAKAIAYRLAEDHEHTVEEILTDALMDMREQCAQACQTVMDLENVRRVGR